MLIRILILSDGRPGHQNLSEGIAAALGRRSKADVSRFVVRRGRWPGRVAAMMTNLRLPPASLLRTVYGIDASAVPATDVIVSAGAETLAASIALARLRGVANIHYGSLRQFREADFALVLTSYAGRATGTRQVFAAKPAAFDPDVLGPPSDPGQWPDGKPGTLGLAIGGDAPDCPFDDADWDGLERLLRATHAQFATAWLVSNSRRTPAAVSDRIARLYAEPGTPVAAFLDVRRPDTPSLRDILCRADALVVTADSSSMVSEGVFARRPVLALAPRRARLTADEHAYREQLAERRLIVTRDIQALDPAGLMEALHVLKPHTHNPLDELAALIADRLPALGL